MSGDLDAGVSENVLQGQSSADGLEVAADGADFGVVEVTALEKGRAVPVH